MGTTTYIVKTTDEELTDCFGFGQWEFLFHDDLGAEVHEATIESRQQTQFEVALCSDDAVIEYMHKRGRVESKNDSNQAIFTTYRQDGWYACSGDLEGANTSKDIGPYQSEHAAIQAADEAIASAWNV